MPNNHKFLTHSLLARPCVGANIGQTRGRVRRWMGPAAKRTHQQTAAHTRSKAGAVPHLIRAAHGDQQIARNAYTRRLHLLLPLPTQSKQGKPHTARHVRLGTCAGKLPSKLQSSAVCNPPNASNPPCVSLPTHHTHTLNTSCASGC